MTRPPAPPQGLTGQDPPVTRLAVVGAGLIGGSIALAAARAGIGDVRLTDASPAVRKRARALGLAARVPDTVAAAVEDVDLVVAAVPAAVVGAVVEEAALHAPPDAILTDAASLKSSVTLEVESRLRSMGRDMGGFVGGHPMAGSERSGPDAADGALFQGATWVLTPTAATSPTALRRTSAFLRALGARVLALSPQRHDELVALVSHLPQVVASTLADVASSASDDTAAAVLSLAGGGFRDTTRIAASDPELWLGILRGNRPAVVEALRAYQRRLGDVTDALAEERWAEVETVLARAGAARRRFAPKPGERGFVDVVVALDDRPGRLATATTALGEAGINVEDLVMRHAEAGQRGALVVRVEAEAAERATAVLRERGLAAHVESLDPGVEPSGGLRPAPPA